MTSTVGSPLRHALHLALAYRPSTGSSPREFAPPESALGASLCRPTLAFQFEFPLPLNDLLAHVQKVDPKLTDKIWILEDAMSPVPPPPLNPLPAHLDFPALANKAIEQWRAAGMHVVKSTDPIS